MEINKFIEKFAEAIEIDDTAALNGDTVFRNLSEWDSLSYLSVIAMLDEEYGIQIEQADLKKLVTLNDMANYIETTK